LPRRGRDRPHRRPPRPGRGDGPGAGRGPPGLAPGPRDGAAAGGRRLRPGPLRGPGTSPGRARRRGGLPRTRDGAHPRSRPAWRRGPAGGGGEVRGGGGGTGEPAGASRRGGSLDAFGRARLARLHARIVFARSRTSEATPLFLDAARLLEPLDAALARETYLEALAAAIFAGRLDGGTTVRDAAEVARAVPRASGTASRTDLLLEGVTQRFTDGYAASLAPLRQALNAFRAEADSGGPGETA